MPPDDKETGEPEEDFVKVDRRASHQPEAEPEASAEGPPPEPEAGPPSEEGLPEISVYSLLRMSLGMYAEQAWIHLGLRMDPRTGKADTDLALAKVAIDTVAFMIEQLQPDLDAADRREVESLLANLRINYVQRA